MEGSIAGCPIRQARRVRPHDARDHEDPGDHKDDDDDDVVFSAVGREQYVSDDDEVVDAGYEIQDADAQEDADGVSSLLSAMDSDDTFGDEDSERGEDE